MSPPRLTMSQALVRYLIAQRIEYEGRQVPLFHGVFAIFGHGNVAGIGEALYAHRSKLPTFRAHNEQAMAHAAIGFTKACRRRRMMACTTSIGPGATNLVTAAATAHVNRLPVLLLPGDTFANGKPDPVLQQLEDFEDPKKTVNDCLRPVSRYWARITTPDMLLEALPKAIETLTDPARCGPVTLALPQDVQVQTIEYPAEFFEPCVRTFNRTEPSSTELETAVTILKSSSAPLLIAGGGVAYANADQTLTEFLSHTQIPMVETQAGKGIVPWDHPLNMGAIGVTGTSAANALAQRADAVLAVGTRLSDFTTGSRRLFKNPEVRWIGLNAARFDAEKHGAHPLVGDARLGLEALDQRLVGWRAPVAWVAEAKQHTLTWTPQAEAARRTSTTGPFSDAQILAAVNRATDQYTAHTKTQVTLVAAAGGLPGELHKLWRAQTPGTYQLEYGYSCMGYEIAGGLGVKMAHPDQGVVVMVGDGSYLMLNSELATSIALNLPLVVVLVDNRGFGCIERLQAACGLESFNNLLDGLTNPADGAGHPWIDFVAHAHALGCHAEFAPNLQALESAVDAGLERPQTSVVVVQSDPRLATEAGGAWWDVPRPEILDPQTR